MIKAISYRDPNEFGTRLVVLDVPSTNDGKVKTLDNRVIYDKLYPNTEVEDLAKAINTVGNFYKFKLIKPKRSK